MRDIFALLKHEGHKLEAIKYDGDIKLGCIYCGTTLYSFSDDFDIKSFKEAFKEIKRRGSSLNIDMLKFCNQILTLEDKDIEQIAKNIIERANEFFKDLDDKDYCFKEFEYVFNLKEEIISHIDSKYEAEDIEVLKEIEELIDYNFTTSIKSIKNKLRLKEEDFIILNPGERYVVSCYDFVLNDSDYNKNSINILCKPKLDEEEKCDPTPTDIYRFKDIKDYELNMPSYDEEEYNKYSFRVFEYRLRNDLYDFSNIDPKDILKITLEEFKDCIEENKRFLLPIEKLFDVKL